MLLSANLGFLYTELPLLARLEAARADGFDAVEFHDQPQDFGAGALAARLGDLGLRVISLNTRMGPETGSAALPGQGARFRDEFEAAQEAAQILGARAVHVVAGRVTGPDARVQYLRNLAWALEQSAIDLLIEPLSPQATPGYHLTTLADFAEVAAALDHPRLKLMADWFHLSATYGAGALEALRPHLTKLGHAQVARPGDRGDPFPDQMLGWAEFRATMEATGVTALGLEYRPSRAIAEVVASHRRDLRAAAQAPQAAR